MELIADRGHLRKHLWLCIFGFWC